MDITLEGHVKIHNIIHVLESRNQKALWKIKFHVKNSNVFARSISEATCDSISTSWTLHSPNQLTQDWVRRLTCATWFSCSHYSFGKWTKTFPLWRHYENSGAFKKAKHGVSFLGDFPIFCFSRAPCHYLLCMSCLWIYFLMLRIEHGRHCLVFQILKSFRSPCYAITWFLRNVYAKFRTERNTCLLPNWNSSQVDYLNAVWVFRNSRNAPRVWHCSHIIPH